MRRHALFAAAPACLLLGLSPATAQAAVAPPADATAAAARVSNLVGVSTTGASADDNDADAQAAVVTLDGDPVLGAGGSQSSNGRSGGALLDTGPAQAPRVKVAPWSASAEGTKDSGRRTSRASASAAEAEIPDTVETAVLTSDAQAEHRDQRSTGSSSSDAATVTVNNTTSLVLLHSEVDSNANGHSYLVGVAGAEIGTEDQLGEVCALDAAGVAAVSCLTATGGVANGVTTGTAEVLGVETALGLSPASAFTASASTAPGSITPPLTIHEDSAEAMLPASEVPRAAEVVTSAPAGLPRTGVAAASLAASGVAGLATGLALRRFGRRSRTGRA